LLRFQKVSLHSADGTVRRDCFWKHSTDPMAAGS
jgi:hypothetical protein